MDSRLFKELRENSGTWALKVLRHLGYSRTCGLKALGHSDTRAVGNLGHLGTLAFKALYLPNSVFRRHIYFLEETYFFKGSYTI